MSEVALYTTVYPAALEFLEQWFGGVRAQTRSDFDLWVGVDGLNVDEASSCFGDPNVRFVVSRPEETPADLRRRALVQIADAYEVAVLVDSDDLVYDTRLEAALDGLEGADVYGCQMDFVDQGGRPVGAVFGPRDGTLPEERLTRTNAFGLSNSAYRCELLGRCLDAPSDCRLFDWYLAQRAWARGARFHFERTSRMGYRIHDQNTAVVLPPFEAEDVFRATRFVLEHYDLLLRVGSWPASYRSQLAAERRRTVVFWKFARERRENLEAYVKALNESTPDLVWWACVAYEGLEPLWRGGTR